MQREIETTLRPQSAILPDTIVELRSKNAEERRGISFNAAGMLEGSDPVLKTETILITAHYDHLGVRNGRVYPGANDNASGTVAVMELARLFAASGKRPKRSVLFLVFGPEEELMLGSFYYTAHPLRPLAGTRAVLNLDMIGRDEAHIPQSEGVLQIPADTRNGLNLVGTYYSPDLLAIIERENRSVGLALDTKFDRDHLLNALFRCDQSTVPGRRCSGGVAVRRFSSRLSRALGYGGGAELSEDGEGHSTGIPGCDRGRQCGLVPGFRSEGSGKVGDAGGASARGVQLAGAPDESLAYRRLPPLAEHFAYLGSEDILRKGFRKECEFRFRQPLRQDHFLRIPRHQQHLEVRPKLQDFHCQFPAVFSGHDDVRQHEMNLTGKRGGDFARARATSPPRERGTQGCRE